MKIEGLFAPFLSWSVDLGGFKERLVPGCFDATLRVDDQRALWGHNVEAPLGRVSAKTLHLSTNRDGLVGWIDLPASAAGYFESVVRGDVRESSFGFLPVLDSWAIDKQTGDVQREILVAKLFEVSPVAFAAYTSTEIHARRGARDTRRERLTATAIQLVR